MNIEATASARASKLVELGKKREEWAAMIIGPVSLRQNIYTDSEAANVALRLADALAKAIADEIVKD